MDSDQESQCTADDTEEEGADGGYRTPRVSISSAWAELCSSPQLPTSSTTAGTSATRWSCEDFGEGVCLADVFDDIDSGDRSANAAKSDHRLVLGSVSFTDIRTMHPNKVFCLVLDYVLPRFDATELKGLKRKGSKHTPSWQEILGRLQEDPLHPIVYKKLDSRMRWLAQNEMMTWIARFSGQSVRCVRQELLPRLSDMRSWKTEDDKVKARFHFLRMLAKEPRYKTLFPEFTDQVRGRSSAAAASGPAVTVAPVKQHVTVCYGFLATYNTNIGQREPRIVRWVQEGIRGEELKQLLMGHPLIKSCFERFAMHLKQIAQKLGFPTWAVCMEHSEHSQHPARVHMHAYAGVDIKSGQGFMGIPRAAAVDRNSLLWEASSPPFVRFTNLRRPSPTSIYNAVASGMYYVAGGKIGSMFLEASLLPFKDSSRGAYSHVGDRGGFHNAQDVFLRRSQSFRSSAS